MYKDTEWALTSHELPSMRIMEHYHNHPELADGMIPLAQVVESWNRGDPWLLVDRNLRFPKANIPMHFLSDVWTRARLEGIEPGVIPYSGSLDTSDHIEALRAYKREEHGYIRHIGLLRTVTVVYPTSEGRYFFLVSGIGDFRVEKEVDRVISKVFGFSNTSVKNRTVNPDPILFESDWLVGYAPGMVKPIIDPRYVRNISGIYYMHNRELDAPDNVAFTASPFEMVVVPKMIFEKSFFQYARTQYPSVQIEQGLGYDLFLTARD